jgi:hypothetical protein
METNQADKFIETEIKGLYQEWKPQDAERSILMNALKYLDYGQARMALNNWFITQTKTFKNPPISQMIQLFRKIYQRNQKRQSNEPVLLYTIIRERFVKEGKTVNCYSQRLYANVPANIPSDPLVIENQAEKHREKMNQLYGENYIILYKNTQNSLDKTKEI